MPDTDKGIYEKMGVDPNKENVRQIFGRLN